MVWMPQTDCAVFTLEEFSFYSLSWMFKYPQLLFRLQQLVNQFSKDFKISVTFESYQEAE